MEKVDCWCFFIGGCCRWGVCCWMVVLVGEC